MSTFDRVRKVVVEQLLQRVVAGHLVFLAALLVQPPRLFNAAGEAELSPICNTGG